MDNTYSLYSNPPRRAPPPPTPTAAEAVGGVGCYYYNGSPYNAIDGYANNNNNNNNRGVTGNHGAGSMSSISIMSSPTPPQYNARRIDNNEYYYGDEEEEYNRYNDVQRHRLYEHQRQQSSTVSHNNRGSYITPDTTTRIPYKPSPQQQASYQYRHASLADNISDHPECIGSYGLPHHYDRRPSPISRPGFEGPTPYRADTIDHTRPSSNIPTGKENTQDINDYDQQYVTNYGEPDGETEPARADDYDEDVSNNMVSNFPIGWKTATRLIPSGEVKREYNMTANRATGVPIHRVRHEAIRFFQILMSPEQPYLQSVGDGWCVNGFMYRLTRDDDVGVLIRQINDGGDNGKDSLLMLNVVMKDVKIERMTPKISAAIEAWDYAIRELVNGNAKAQMVRSQRNGAFRSYLDQYYFPGIPTSCLPSWVKLSRPPRVVKQEYLTQDQVYGRCTQGTSQQAFINPSGNETFHRQGVTYGGGGVSLLSSSSAGVCDEYRVLYDI